MFDKSGIDPLGVSRQALAFVLTYFLSLIKGQMNGWLIVLRWNSEGRTPSPAFFQDKARLIDKATAFFFCAADKACTLSKSLHLRHSHLVRIP